MSDQPFLNQPYPSKKARLQEPLERGGSSSTVDLSDTQYWDPLRSSYSENAFAPHMQVENSLVPVILSYNYQQPGFKSANASHVCDSDISRNDVTMDVVEELADLVCFGMFIGIPGSAQQIEAQRSRVKLENPSKFVGIESTDLEGEVDLEFTYLTTALLEETGLELQAMCITPTDSSKLMRSRKYHRMPSLSSKCTLEIILYGSVELVEPIWTFIEECNEFLDDQQKLYLQDPIGCERNVPYCNPHRLPSLKPEIVRFTSKLGNDHHGLVELEHARPIPDLSDLLGLQEDLPEALQPPMIATPMQKHQKQALTFMLQREEGWALHGTRADIWEVVGTQEDHCFVNRVTGARQTDQPPPFYGGIISDPMGFGKTLSMITLIASDYHCLRSSDERELFGVLQEKSNELTLIVVPPACECPRLLRCHLPDDQAANQPIVLGTWEEELKFHITPDTLRWRLHHGKSRVAHISQLEGIAIVLTTYHTVSTEWKNGKAGQTSALFTTRWRRIILDEAHYIRNSESQMAQAVFELESVSRWAVTGTPIQNRLNDFSALIKFIGAYPYSDKKMFEADISHLWKTGNAEEAVTRLKYLIRCLLLCRPRETIQLPPRHDKTCHVEFDPEERRLYTQVRTQAVARLDDALQHIKGDTKTVSFVNVLQQIEVMRIVCNLGLHYQTRHDIHSNMEIPVDNHWQESAQRLFNLYIEQDSAHCHYCSCIINTTSHTLGDTEPKRTLFTQCFRSICADCTLRTGQKIKTLGCGHDPPCPVAEVSLNLVHLEEAPIRVSLSGTSSSQYFPAKVKALVRDIQQLPYNTKCAVFSTWRMTLDVVEAAFEHNNIKSLRFDGKVPHKNRQAIIQEFRKGTSARVLLLTISCGAVGLTLTAASRAYLMEPHWNPTLEDQALARIHRIGQMKEVTTVRFYIRDSFEETVVKNQGFKRDLASILLAPGRPPADNMSHLERLRSLI